jgi:hypothetical protein
LGGWEKFQKKKKKKKKKICKKKLLKGKKKLNLGWQMVVKDSAPYIHVGAPGAGSLWLKVMKKTSTSNQRNNEVLFF